ncbi:hypothetical protein LCGC14_1291320 [marine sediment metagenome]|uniref:Disease resistance R13L4/SHOC-2-like LRR domain-containing protein n=1 Tax=marine sediment metagenome TaxID=412755 RepID=A0A0F9N8S0_9ZZZZ|nr:hypothetical protein [bacterium]
MEKYRINEYLTLKLENEKTNIYVNDKKFIQCKYLLINQPKNRNFETFDSIDEYSEALSSDLESTLKIEDLGISYEEEFRAHCSNLQAWAELEYDTRLLKSNLSFPLLKKLTEAGDPLARNVFKEEIGRRLESGYLPVMKYLNKEGYINYLENDEMYYSLLEPEQAKALFSLSKVIKERIEPSLRFYEDLDVNPYEYFIVENKRVTALRLWHLQIRLFPTSAIEEISKLTSLEVLQLSNNIVGKFPTSFSNLQKLKSLNIKAISMGKIPESLTRLNSLEDLDISSNNLTNIPNSIENLTELKELRAENNRIKSLPEAISKLFLLKSLNLSNNRLISLPETIGELKNLDELRINRNNIKELPLSVGNLQSLDFLHLGQNNLRELPDSFVELKLLITLYLNDNKELDKYIIERLPDLIDKMPSLRNLYLDETQIELIPKELRKKRRKNRQIIIKYR